MIRKAELGRTLRWTAAGLIFCLVPGCRNGAADGAAKREMPPVVVQTTVVEAKEIPRTIAAVGGLESPQSTQLAAEVSGRIVYLDISEGQEVEAGHELARLDEQQARASVSVAEARFRNAQATVRRLKTLGGAKLIAQQELDDAQAELDAAQGELEQARVALDKTTIRAPFSGVLGLRQVSLGAFVDAGDPIVRVTQIDPLHLRFSLPQQAFGELHLGQKVRGVVGHCGTRFGGQVSAVDPYVDPATRTLQVQAQVPNGGRKLLPGMATTLKVELESVPNALTVPESAIVRQGTARFVYTVDEDRTVARHDVTLGEYLLGEVQVTSGLPQGATVVAAGHQKLRPGAKVETSPFTPTENPNLQLGSLDARCDF
jgi:membrane fusion protein (multidrug efflux system)